MPPFIGQGLNSGLRDAISLSWRLSMIKRGISTPQLMQSYSAERRTHVEAIIDIAVKVGVPLCESDEEKAKIMVRAGDTFQLAVLTLTDSCP
jgi:2-polyprenyl-6-methoxyphenol hydroxylase-like FAD-dependent oxidoreductase